MPEFMSPHPSITPPLPEIIQPPCPTCPDPDSARRINTPCTGPEVFEDPFSADLDEVDTQNLRALAQAIGSPACGDFVFCPRAHGRKIPRK
ncbi:MAG: hypothetical protein QG628_281 [Patescibacteria group bacterium]|jgi:hypothetical protein|nr:hypothetical protein [Patescibacteria group bacterium]